MDTYFAANIYISKPPVTNKATHSRPAYNKAHRRQRTVLVLFENKNLSRSGERLSRASLISTAFDKKRNMKRIFVVTISFISCKASNRKI